MGVEFFPAAKAANQKLAGFVFGLPRPDLTLRLFSSLPRQLEEGLRSGSCVAKAP